MNQPRRLRMSKLALGLVVALAAAPSFAQSTSSGVGGVVTDAGGQPVVGAEITITHAESGTVSRAITDASGRYNARGLRVGGPYTIVVVKAGSGTDTEDNIFLALNQVSTVNAVLTGDLTTLETVTAVGFSGGSDVFSSTKMGAGTSIDRQTIDAMPSVGGNIQDLMRLDPRVTFVDRASGSISAGGQNPRFNSINIDGVAASDTFGLEGNNMTTRRQPVSMAAIEAIDIKLSSYDVSAPSASGATVNAVTKSGTNEFHGSVYGTYRDGDWFGDDPTGKPFTGFTDESTYGVVFGGPIIKDKLFFFANYEKFQQSAPGADLSGTAYGKANPVITDAVIGQVQDIAKNVWGIDAGTLQSNTDTDLEEYALKLDWNINENHRASLRYSKLEQSKLRLNGMASSSVSLSSYWFQHEKAVESYVGQVFSDWSDNFSTEFKVSYRDYSAIRAVSTNAPSIQIQMGNDSLYLGTELSSQNNILQTETWNYFGAGTWTLGDHDIKFGVDYSSNDVFNYFAQNGWGAYVFQGVENFRNGIWSTYRLAAEKSPGSIPARYKSNNLGLFVQDTWYPNSNLTLTFGLRADKADTSPAPAYNGPASAYFGYNNSELFSGNFLIQPRFGFNYTFDSDRPTQLRGGVGLFQGDAPQVWVGNSYSNTGLNTTAYNQTTYNPLLPFSPDGSNQPIPTAAGSALQTVNFVTNDFKMPSLWKANLAIDHELPWWGMVASAELMVTKVRDALYYDNLNLGPGYVGLDGRRMYWNPTKITWSSGDTSNGSAASRFNRAAAYDQVLLLRNTDEGSTQQFTVGLSKPWSTQSDWSWNLAYTYTQAEEVGPLASSVAASNWNSQLAFNSNENIASTSRYEIKDRISGSLNWKHNFFGDYQTSVGLVYEGRSGRPYSYVYVNDFNGDGRGYNDLFYVPTGPGDVKFGTVSAAGAFTADPVMEQRFWDWLQANPQLAKHAGNVAPANGFRSSFVNTFDVRFSQQLPGFFKGHKSEVWLDIQNVGNLINKDWGHIMDYGFNANASVARLAGIHDGKYVYNFTGAQTPTPANGDADSFNIGVSQWSLQVGLKYDF